ncbi:MAG: BNR-4 repeat-containing protein [Thermoleophilaceae bacterium]|nr:BNR-4 repeat-containing protein [Thermoleophilaceae bacterium]
MPPCGVRESPNGAADRPASGAWGPEQTIATNLAGPYGFTYPNPVRLADEAKTYLFWRGGNLDPTFSTRGDAVAENDWAPARGLIHVPNNEPGPAAERPYLKYASDGQDTIHFAYTNAHPNENPDVNIYYGRIRAGRVEAADGADISELGTPIAPRDADRVFDGAGPAWIYDVAVGADGRPVVVFASFATGTSATDHLYHYARWNGSSWEVHQITPAGGSISTGGRSPLYSGGLSLDHDDPTNVYLSRQVGQGWSVEAWRTPDGGQTWTSRILTPNPTVKNVRPLSPRGDEPGGETVLWMSGAYPNYNTLQTAVTSFIDDPPPPVFTPAPSPAPAQGPVPVAPKQAPATTPRSDVRLARATASSRVVRIGKRGGGALAVRCVAQAGDRCKVAGSLRLGSSRIGVISGNVLGGRRATVRVRLTKQGLRRLRRLRRLDVRLVPRRRSPRPA